jgi:endonuclease/exonuclease/phosphatase family metal-dependent hydrolase
MVRNCYAQQRSIFIVAIVIMFANNLVQPMTKCLLYLLFFMPIVLLADSIDMAVMTYNIRMNTPTDGENAWPKRKEWVVDVITQSSAGIVGLQEVKPEQKKYIVKAMKGYGNYGVGRDNGSAKGEHCLILYKESQYELLDSGTIWLSETPNVPGSKSWDAAITRIASWVKLQHKTSGREFFFFNTHFDHKGQEARYQSILLLKSKIKDMAVGLPVIVVGDFNFRPDSKPYAEINNALADYVLFDSFTIAQHKDGELTCCGFDASNKNCSRIDYVLVNNAFKVITYKVISESRNGSYPSDHLPVVCKLRF